MNSQLIKVFSYNSSINLYNTIPDLSVNVGGYIYSIWININGTKMYLATNPGVKQIDWNGTTWIVSVPSYLSTLIGSTVCTYVTLVNNE